MNANQYTYSMFYLDSLCLNKQLNISLHFQKLSSIIGGHTIPSKIQNLASLKKQLKNNRCEVIYFLAHSDKNKGMYIGENSNVNGEKLATLFSSQPGRIPKLVIFNTCYGFQSRLVEATLNAGVKMVIATQSTIPIAQMCAYIEKLNKSCRINSETIKESVLKTNELFKQKKVRFETFVKQNGV